MVDIQLTDAGHLQIATQPLQPGAAVAQASEAEASEDIEAIRNASDLYSFKRLLGRGAFGKVHEALFKPTGEAIAVKILRNGSNPRQEARIKREVALMKQLDHPNIVKFKHVYKTDENFYLGMELVRDGSLDQLMKQRQAEGKRFSDLEVSCLLKSILSALAHIHEKDTVHRDLKPSNILLNDINDLSSVKIIDFGLSEKYVLNEDFSAECGTLFYMAPEVVKNGGKISKSVDIWAVGIVMFLLFSEGSHAHPFGVTPYDTRQQFQSKMERQRDADVLSKCSNLSPISKKFLERLIQIDRSLRYTAQDALQHPWITRQKQNKIPLSLVDQMSHMNFEKILRRKFNLVYFLGVQKLHQQAQEQAQLRMSSTADSEPQNLQGPANEVAVKTEQKSDLKRLLDEIGTSAYKKKAQHFSKRIDQWHKEQCKINTGIFENDTDFVELDRSPSRFDQPPPQGESSIDDFLLKDQEVPGQPKQDEASDLKTIHETVDEGKPSPSRKSPTKQFSMGPRKTQPLTSSKTRRTLFNKSKGLSLKLKELSPIRVAEREDNSAKKLVSPTDSAHRTKRNRSVARHPSSVKKLLEKTDPGSCSKDQGSTSVPKAQGQVFFANAIQFTAHGRQQIQAATNERNREGQQREHYNALSPQPIVVKRRSDISMRAFKEMTEKILCKTGPRETEASQDQPDQTGLHMPLSAPEMKQVDDREEDSYDGPIPELNSLRINHTDIKRKAVADAVTRLITEKNMKKFSGAAGDGHITIEGDERDFSQRSQGTHHRDSKSVSPPRAFGSSRDDSIIADLNYSDLQKVAMMNPVRPPALALQRKSTEKFITKTSLQEQLSNARIKLALDRGATDSSSLEMLVRSSSNASNSQSLGFNNRGRRLFANTTSKQLDDRETEEECVSPDQRLLQLANQTSNSKRQTFSSQLDKTHDQQNQRVSDLLSARRKDDTSGLKLVYNEQSFDDYQSLTVQKMRGCLGQRQANQGAAASESGHELVHANSEIVDRPKNKVKSKLSNPAAHSIRLLSSKQNHTTGDPHKTCGGAGDEGAGEESQELASFDHINADQNDNHTGSEYDKLLHMLEQSCETYRDTQISDLIQVGGANPKLSLYGPGSQEDCLSVGVLERSKNQVALVGKTTKSKSVMGARSEEKVKGTKKHRSQKGHAGNQQEVKKWLQYMTVGHLTSHLKVNSNQKVQKSRQKQSQQASQQDNAAKILEHMKRQNVNSEILHKLLLSKQPEGDQATRPGNRKKLKASKQKQLRAEPQILKRESSQDSFVRLSKHHILPVDRQAPLIKQKEANVSGGSDFFKTTQKVIHDCSNQRPALKKSKTGCRPGFKNLVNESDDPLASPKASQAAQRPVYSQARDVLGPGKELGFDRSERKEPPILIPQVTVEQVPERLNTTAFTNCKSSILQLVESNKKPIGKKSLAVAPQRVLRKLSTDVEQLGDYIDEMKSTKRGSSNSQKQTQECSLASNNLRQPQPQPQPKVFQKHSADLTGGKLSFASSDSRAMLRVDTNSTANRQLNRFLMEKLHNQINLADQTSSERVVVPPPQHPEQDLSPPPPLLMDTGKNRKGTSTKAQPHVGPHKTQMSIVQQVKAPSLAIVGKTSNILPSIVQPAEPQSISKHYSNQRAAAKKSGHQQSRPPLKQPPAI